VNPRTRAAARREGAHRGQAMGDAAFVVLSIALFGLLLVTIFAFERV
jgi:hypothetical protein